MAKKPDQNTIDAIRKDTAAGEMSTNEIAEKHGVTWATAKKYGGAASSNGKRSSPPQGSCHDLREVASPIR